MPISPQNQLYRTSLGFSCSVLNIHRRLQQEARRRMAHPVLCCTVQSGNFGLVGCKPNGEGTVYNDGMAKDVIRISEAEAASDFAALIARVRAGAKVIIENGEQPVAVIHAAEPVRRGISECIALAKTHEEETGKAPLLDSDFAEDVESIVSHREPWNPLTWE
jgi:antitoxin (DNA-binding transcriptional repressor) of toxin-antitoxin stability system